jgi:hypothetical protein
MKFEKTSLIEFLGRNMIEKKWYIEIIDSKLVGMNLKTMNNI